MSADVPNELLHKLTETNDDLGGSPPHSYEMAAASRTFSCDKKKTLPIFMNSLKLHISVQIYLEQAEQDMDIWGHPRHAEDFFSSSGSLSPDKKEMWRYGCPTSPDRDGDTEVRTVGEEASEYAVEKFAPRV